MDSNRRRIVLEVCLVVSLMLMIGLPRPARQVRKGAVSTSNTSTGMRFFTSKFPGLGRVRIIIKEAHRSTPSPLVRPFQEFLGVARGYDFESRVTAQQVLADGKSVMRISFFAPLLGGSGLYRILVDEETGEVLKQRRIHLRAKETNCEQDAEGESHGDQGEHSFRLGTQTFRRHLRLGIFLDTKWQQRFGALSRAQASFYTREAELFFQEAFGIALTIVHIQEIEYDVTDDSNEGTTLGAINDFKTNWPFIKVREDIDAAHLFMGMRIPSATDSSVGRAYLGTMCNGDQPAFGVSVHFDGSLFSKILAHELGHNLGAPHVDEGIMRPGGLPTLLGFSPESISRIDSHIRRYDCLQEITEKPDDQFVAGGGAEVKGTSGTVSGSLTFTEGGAFELKVTSLTNSMCPLMMSAYVGKKGIGNATFVTDTEGVSEYVVQGLMPKAFKVPRKMKKRGAFKITIAEVCGTKGAHYLDTIEVSPELWGTSAATARRSRRKVRGMPLKRWVRQLGVALSKGDAS